MARAVTSGVKRCGAYEPLYDINPLIGDSIEVFYADDELAKSFDAHTGWFWWTCRCGSVPNGPPTGPFATSCGAYRNVAIRLDSPIASNSRAV